MLNLDAYLKNPCGTLSIPYWKNKNIVIPTNMRIVHDRELCAEMLSDYTDEQSGEHQYNGTGAFSDQNGNGKGSFCDC